MSLTRFVFALDFFLISLTCYECQLPEDFANNLPPGICKALENWGIPCQALSSQEPLVAAERDYFRQLLIHAGLAKVLWAGLHLTVLHIYIPIASTSHKKLEQQSPAIQLAKVNNSAQGLKQENNLWAGAKGFWYQIIPILKSHWRLSISVK